MKKTMLVTLTLLLIFTISCIAYSNNNINRVEDKNDYYIRLEKDYGISATIHFRRYEIQKILDVPKIEVHTVGNEKILTYRTEFHNGSENGCLKIFNKVEGNKLVPFFVLEELFYISRNNYYQRVVKKFSYNQIEYELYEIQGEEKIRMLNVVLQENKNDFEIKSIKEVKKDFSDTALFFSDVYEGLRIRILNSTY